MGQALLRLRDSNDDYFPSKLSNHSRIGIDDHKKRIELSQKIAPFITALTNKIIDCYNEASLLNLPQKGAVMFSDENDESIVFRCGAQFILEIPKEFIESMSNESIIMLDFLIKEWVFTFNEQEIPVDVWLGHPFLNSPKLLQSVPARTAHILDKKEGFWNQKLHEFRAGLLPKTFGPKGEDITGYQVPKLTQSKFSKFPRLKITKRIQD